MKRYVLFSSLVWFVSTFLFSCSTKESSFKDVSEKGTLSAYKEYIQKYPTEYNTDVLWKDPAPFFFYTRPSFLADRFTRAIYFESSEKAPSAYKFYNYKLAIKQGRGVYKIFRLKDEYPFNVLGKKLGEAIRLIQRPTRKDIDKDIVKLLSRNNLKFLIRSVKATWGDLDAFPELNQDDPDTLIDFVMKNNYLLLGESQEIKDFYEELFKHQKDISFSYWVEYKEMKGYYAESKFGKPLAAVLAISPFETNFYLSSLGVVNKCNLIYYDFNFEKLPSNLKKVARELCSSIPGISTSERDLLWMVIFPTFILTNDIPEYGLEKGYNPSFNKGYIAGVSINSRSKEKIFVEFPFSGSLPGFFGRVSVGDTKNIYGAIPSPKSMLKVRKNAVFMSFSEPYMNEPDKPLKLLRLTETDSRLKRLKEELVQALEISPKDLPPIWVIPKAKEINAFINRVGIYIYGGAIEKLSVPEIAAILAHELAQWVEGHLMKNEAIDYLLDAVLTISFKKHGWSNKWKLSRLNKDRLLLTGLSRRHYKTEADASAVKILLKTPYGVEPMKNLLRKLGEEEAKRTRDLIFFSSHPSPLQRIENIKKITTNLVD